MLEEKKVYITKDIGEGYVYDLMSFGYTISKVKKEKIDKKKAKCYYLSRDDEMANYSDICALENEYEKVRLDLTPYPTINPYTAFLMCILIFPLLAYHFEMSMRIKATNVKNEPIYFKMRELMDEASKLILDKSLE